VPRLDRKVVLVTRRTRLEELIARYHTEAQARFYVEHLGADFRDYELEHRTYQQAREVVTTAIESRARLQVMDRSLVPNYLFAPDDIVIALGQDGLVANTLKYLQGQPLVGVNPDPHRYDGILLPFEARDIAPILDDLLLRGRSLKTVSLAKAALSDGQTRYAVNDLFIGPKSHTSARYEIRLGEKSEMHSSSGVIVSTGLGSTGWLRSIITGSTGITATLTAHSQPVPPIQMPWDARYLQFAVREPFPSVSSQVTLVFGTTDAKHPLVLRSMMPENGVIFSDGMEADFLNFTSGVTASISIAERVGLLVQ
jgi:NAD kinase